MSISAAILAGGRATRYGGLDKGALLVDGRSIRDRQIAELAAKLTDSNPKMPEIFEPADASLF